MAPEELGAGALMAEFATSVYSDNAAEEMQSLGQGVVVSGTAADIVWMVTEGFQTNREGGVTRCGTVAIKGFDASDKEVDKLRLANRIATANPVLLGRQFNETNAKSTGLSAGNILVHGGVLDIAKELYADIMPHLDNAHPDTVFTFTGHSMGGCLSVVLLLLIAQDRGVEFVKKRIKTVYTFGAPPVLALHDPPPVLPDSTDSDHDEILHAAGLPSSLVKGFVQPWDPIVRLFSYIDPFYPLVVFLGKGGIMPFVSGPQRVLRPIMKTILENLDFWPDMKPTVVGQCAQNYVGVGMQHIVLPAPSSYLTDPLAVIECKAMQLDMDPVETVLAATVAGATAGARREFPPGRILHQPGAGGDQEHQIPLPACVQRSRKGFCARSAGRQQGAILWYILILLY
eukprot:CAMPEP_0194282336 /NCGR_PEP_ID=MMETSP0169-20130528/22926_1 /TAXON_ID=218684 /ORGANISM="Corethron pennatum, Strain L29A3" /LENGTH=399 /DNA_ID=CAMNT_0039027617 /DNA_START=158 /DNA_END=1356 /DNA_ORIENTATION=+